MSAWLRTGRDITEFWIQTPRTLALVLKASADLRKEERHQRLSLAWHIAKLSRAQRIPALKQLLAEPTVTAIQSEGQMRAAFAAWRAAAEDVNDGASSVR